MTKSILLAAALCGVLTTSAQEANNSNLLSKACPLDETVYNNVTEFYKVWSLHKEDGSPLTDVQPECIFSVLNDQIQFQYKDLYYALPFQDEAEGFTSGSVLNVMIFPRVNKNGIADQVHYTIEFQVPQAGEYTFSGKARYNEYTKESYEINKPGSPIDEKAVMLAVFSNTPDKPNIIKVDNKNNITGITDENGKKLPYFSKRLSHNNAMENGVLKDFAKPFECTVTLPAGKQYLHLYGPKGEIGQTGLRPTSIVFGDLKLISANTQVKVIPVMTEDDVKHYDLQGFKIDEPKAGNIYIQVKGGKASKVQF